MSKLRLSSFKLKRRLEGQYARIIQQVIKEAANKGCMMFPFPTRFVRLTKERQETLSRCMATMSKGGARRG